MNFNVSTLDEAALTIDTIIVQEMPEIITTAKPEVSQNQTLVIFIISLLD